MRMKWRFINTGFNNGIYNMAVDEAVMQFVAKGESPPTLRFYGWTPAAVSLGYFQSAAKEVDFDRCKDMGIDVVRRLTGGRAILHDMELTYSVMISENYPGMPTTVTESYKLLSDGLMGGLLELGIQAHLVSRVTLKPAEFASGACFDAPSSYELVVDGKKIVGSAQVRQRGAILQHGSILNELDADKLFNCLLFSDDKVRERAKSIFTKKAISIKDARGKRAEWEELCNAFFIGFEKGLKITLEPGELTSDELKLASELYEKYSSKEWNLKK